LFGPEAARLLIQEDDTGFFTGILQEFYWIFYWNFTGIVKGFGKCEFRKGCMLRQEVGQVEES
jgi:hypothetical protein